MKIKMAFDLTLPQHRDMLRACLGVWEDEEAYEAGDAAGGPVDVRQVWRPRPELQDDCTAMWRGMVSSAVPLKDPSDFWRRTAEGSLNVRADDEATARAKAALEAFLDQPVKPEAAQ